MFKMLQNIETTILFSLPAEDTPELIQVLVQYRITFIFFNITHIHFLSKRVYFYAKIINK